MAPPMKPDAQRQRRNLRSTKATVDADRATKPSLIGAVSEPHKMTQTWWDVVWSSPISEEWVDADVPGLLALALLVDNFWSSGGDAKLHAEVRMASQQFGLSPFSRRQLQWEVRRIERATPRTPDRRAPRGRSVLSVLEGKAG